MLHSRRGFVLTKNIILITVASLIVLSLGTTVAVIKFSNNTIDNTCIGGVCPSATSTITFPEPPNWSPTTQCGDGVCNPNEKANPNVCPQDCAVVENVPDPIINSFIATPARATMGQPVTLSWSSTSTFCAAAGNESSWFVTGGAALGSVETRALMVPTTFILSCMAEDGVSITKSVTVDVIQPIVKVPIITMSAKPESIGKGKTATITWSTMNATSCTASGGGTSSTWKGSRPLKGSYTTPPLMTSQSYTLSCVGDGKTSLRKVTVSVAQGPQITFTATPSKVTAGEKVTLAWLAPNATSCTAGGAGVDWGWTGKLSASGVQTTAPLKESQMFSITCENGVGGTTTKEVQVVVSVPKLSLTLTPSTQSVSYGKVATLKWTSAGAIKCTGTGPWADSTFGLSDTKFTQPLTSPSILEVTCTGDSGTTITQKATVNVAEAAKCSFAGGTILNGGTVTTYQSAAVPFGSSCVSEVRTCSNGTLTGTYTNNSCMVTDAKACTSSTFGTVAHGASVSAYQNQVTATPSAQCVSETRTCSNGVLSGTYTYPECFVASRETEETRTLCTDHYVKIKVDYSGVVAKLKWVDSTPGGVLHGGCGETSGTNADPKDSDGWHIYKKVYIPLGKTLANFCMGDVCTTKNETVVSVWSKSGTQYPSYFWKWNAQ